MELTTVLMHAEEGGFVALNPETSTTTQGESVEAAVANLKEATALYLEEFPMAVSGRPAIALDRATKKRPAPKELSGR